MTVAEIAPSIDYAEDGTTLTFPIPFGYIATSHVSAYRVIDDAIASLIAGRDYSVAGGWLTLSATVAGAVLRVYRATPRAQEHDYLTTDTFPAESHERALDRDMYIEQEQDRSLTRGLARTIRVPEPETIAELPAKALRRNTFPLFDGNGTFSLATALVAAGVLAPYLPEDLRGLPGGNAMAIGLITALGSMTIPTGTDMVQTNGFGVRGKGMAKYIRLGVAPAQIERNAGLNKWVFQDASGAWFRLAEAIPNQLQFGVVGDANASFAAGMVTYTGTDDTAALQAWADFVIFWNDAHGTTGELARVPMLITETIHLGYGDEYITFKIRGMGHWAFNPNAQAAASAPGFASSRKMVQAGIHPTFNNRPAINIASARLFELEGFAVIGLNHRWLTANYNTMTDRRDRANWYGPQMQSGVNTIYAPYAGIAVDAFCAPRSGVSSYPDAVYPTWVTAAAPNGRGITTQYNKGASSQGVFRNLAVNGFEIGICIQPNTMPSASNGDFMRVQNCELSFNHFAYTVSHPDSRVVSVDQTMMHFCFCGISNRDFGTQNGNFLGAIKNCSFDGCTYWFSLNLGTTGIQKLAPALLVENCYTEGGWSIGTLNTNTSAWNVSGAKFVGCQFGLRGDRFSSEYSPVWHLDGRGVLPVTFENCSFMETHGMVAINAKVRAINVTFPLAWHSRLNAGGGGENVAVNALCGMYASEWDEAALSPFAFRSINGQTITGARHKSHGFDPTAAGNIVAGSGGSYGVAIPLFVKTVNLRGEFSVPEAPRWTIDRGAFNLGSYSNTAGDHSFTLSLDACGAPDYADYWLAKGDIVKDNATDILYYVRAITWPSGFGTGKTASVTLRQLTNIRTADGSTWANEAAIGTSSGGLSVIVARRSLIGLTRPLVMTATAASADVTFAEFGAEALSTNEMGGSSLWTVNVGDYLLGGNHAPDKGHSVFPAYTKVTVVTQSGGAPTGDVTLSANARRDSFERAPVMIRTAL